MMTDDELEHLNRDGLLELVRRLQDDLAEREAAIERRDETIRELDEELAQFRSVDHALEEARSRKVMPVEPRVLVDGGVARVLMPGEPGYDDA